MLRINQGASSVAFAPVGANAVSPTVVRTGRAQTVSYANLWPGVDVDYQVESAQLKETLVLHSAGSTNRVGFRLTGASLTRAPPLHHQPNGFRITGALGDQFGITPVNLILNKFGYTDTHGDLHQTFHGGVLSIGLKRSYLKSLPTAAFPVAIDPGVYRSTFGTRVGGGNYIAFKTDGTVCYSNTCNLYAGGLYDKNYNFQYWRGAYFAPYELFRNKGIVLTHANLHLTQLTGVSFWTGTTDTHTFTIGHATCLNSFNCVDGWYASSRFATVGDLDATAVYQNAINSGDYGAWMMVGGEDGSDSSYKNFNPDYSYVDFTYRDIPPVPSLAVPSDGQVFVDPQASLKVNPAGNPNSATPLQYEVSVSSASGGTGQLVDSGVQNSTLWTVPDGVLQDGTTYYAQTRSYDPTTGFYSAWSNSTSFRIDLRTGQDSTQTFDTLGPVSADLATGNVSVSASSHTSGALGGSLGVSLNYNSPLRSRSGLVGDYWNVPANYPGGMPTGAPNLTRVDQNVDFDWNTDSPAPGQISADWFFAHWSGYYVAPATGSYSFGGVNDDQMVVNINGTPMYSNGGCYGTPCYGTSSVSLQAGQVVPISIEYEEATGAGYAHLYVNGPNYQGVIPQSSLSTGARPVAVQHGLVGHYYKDDGSHNLDATGKQLFLQRTDPTVSFNWGTGAPIPGAPSDNFMVRWSGYVTAPVDGSYKFGTTSDDGSRITLGDSNTVVLNAWVNATGIENFDQPFPLTAGQPTPITVDYFEGAGGASINLEVENADGSAKQSIPSSWLSPSAQVLPAGWTLGVDPDGDISYDHLKANQNSVVLSDSTGDTHEYTFQNGGYKPPVNEDGQLVRNDDGSFTLQDSDGRTYIFRADGVLTSVTSATDDRHPAALRYTYAAPAGGGPARITRISDGANPARNAVISYYGDAGSSCATPPDGFDSAYTSGGLLCAVTTNDGRVTNFYYLAGQLSRIAEPGTEITDYQYGPVTNADGSVAGWRLTGLRDAVANDAIAAHFRADDSTAITAISYDSLGRVAEVTEPAANTGNAQIQNTIEYLPAAADGSYAGLTREHVVGAPEPNGFTRQVQYDNLYRTTKDTDVANLSTTTVWNAKKDLVYSTTDPTGLMQSTVYDDEDRAASQYGPAPTDWYDASVKDTDGNDLNGRLPLSAYAAQVPRTDTSYDGGITGAAVAWFNTRTVTTNGITTPAFYGAPKLHTTGITPGVDPNWMGRKFSDSPAPITVDSGSDSYGFSATGKLRVPSTGVYTLNLYHDDAARVWIDDTLVVDDWANVGDSQNHNSASFTVSDTKPHRFRFDYANRNTPGAVELWLSGPGITDASNGQNLGTSHWSDYLSPDYSLETSSITYDATIGNAVTKTNYGSTPELGLPISKTLDPAGVNYTSQLGYEAPGSGFLRQTSKTLPGGNTTTYGYYAGNATADNPCTAATETYLEGGMLSLKTEPDPDGAGPQLGRTTQTIYDDAGRIVATRYNQDPWTCTYYDPRGRITETDIPAINGAPARTITNNWAGGGNPLIVASTDDKGTISTRTDLLGRTTTYTDVYGDTTYTAYDALGRVSKETSPRGTVVYSYDTYNRLIKETIDGATYALPHYDQFSRLSTVSYPNAGKLALSATKYDALGRQTGVTYTMGDGTTKTSDNVTRSQSGQITSGTENGLAKRYTYDLADRLTAATIGVWKFGYSYATPTQCYGDAVSTANRNSNVTSIRTSFNGTAKTQNYCYDNADRLYSSSDKNIEMPLYDSHGNTTRLGSTWNGGTTVTSFSYDSSDRSTDINQNYGAQEVAYNRDVGNRIIMRWVSQSGTKVDAGFYDYTGPGDSPDYERDSSWQILEEYFQLPGGVLLSRRPSRSVASERQMYSVPDLHGDILRTVDATGTKVADYAYSPYGQLISQTTNNLTTPATPLANQPANAYAHTSFSWLGKNQKFDESSLVLTPIQMGARVYIPVIGRFTQVDPQEGGTENNYTYPSDPVNEFDLDGNSSWGSALKVVTRVASIGSFVPGPVGMVCGTVSLAIALKEHDTKGAVLAAAGILGGPIAGHLAEKFTTINRIIAPVVERQARLPLVGKSSFLFGNSKFRASRGVLNGRFGDQVKIGWSYRGSNASFRIGLLTRNNAYAYTVSRFHLNYGRLRVPW